MRIVKCKAGQRERLERIPGFVYCGREWGGFPCSPLANEYRVGRDGTLAEVLTKYRRWLWGIIQGGLRYEDGGPLNRLEGLTEDSVLGCWCLDKAHAGEGPDQCHCDVIARAARWLRQQTSGKR